MRTKTMFITAILLICSAVVSAQHITGQAIGVYNDETAQTSVTKSVERYITANGQIASQKATLKQTLVAIPRMMNMDIPSGYTAESLAEKYMKERFAEDFAATISPYIIQQNVTAAEIDEITEMFNTPEGKMATAHAQKMTSQEGMADVMAIAQRDLISILTKDTYQKTEVKASAERRALFAAYYKSSGIEKMISPLLNAISQGKVPDSIMAKFNAYFQENMLNLVLNASEGILTDDDLRFYEKMCNKPQYTKMIDGVTNAISNPQEMGISIITKYNIWVTSL